MKKGSNLYSNIEHRFISKVEGSFKVHIHLPDDSIRFFSIGYGRLGEKRALKLAIKKRDHELKIAWKKHWHRVLEDRFLFTRLPQSIEPRIIFKPRGDKVDECYIAVLRSNAPGIGNKSVVRSIYKWGRKEAYKQTKSRLLEHYADVVEILVYMNRISKEDLSLDLP